MTNKPTDGGPVYPVTHKQNSQSKALGYEDVQHYGLTIRDYVAAQALQGTLAGSIKEIFTEASPDKIPDGLAAFAYAIADAMLKAREQ